MENEWGKDLGQAFLGVTMVYTTTYLTDKCSF